MLVSIRTVLTAALVGALPLTASATASATQPPAPRTERITSAPDGSPAGFDTYEASMSPDGRYVAFPSWAPGLVPGDPEHDPDLFVRDVRTGTLRRIPIVIEGDTTGWSAENVSISADGRFLTFAARHNGPPDDGTPADQIYVHDLRTGSTERASVGLHGRPGVAWRDRPGISADGRYVLFTAWANSMESDEDKGIVRAYVRDRVTGTTTRVSPVDGEYIPSRPSMSADGRRIAFTFGERYMGPDYPYGPSKVIVVDRPTGRETVAHVGRGAGGTVLSADGRKLLFNSDAPDVVPGDGNGEQDAFVRDLETGRTVRVSEAAGGGDAHGWSEGEQLSADGRFAVLASTAPDLVEPRAGGDAAVYVRDLRTGRTTRIDLAHDGTPLSGVFDLAGIAPDGHRVAFASNAPNVLPDADSTWQVYLRTVR
ncbi:PD40 domain-containing protein [Streptomyces sannanensis]|uniref:PD40 domain-containing protein n=1 Tax=Streptomyces sannanensis TaxID=285536 RepID=A0ABP6SGG2_9ACTN